jgi:undecaprenyl-diphosphatase
MLELLAELDKVLFIIINLYLANPITDFIMPIVTSDNVLKVTYALILIVLLWRGDRRLRWMVLFSGLTILLCDQSAASWLKPWLARPRPCHVFTEINLLVGCGGGFAMPSAHAANVFGQAFLFRNEVGWWRWPLFIFAFLVAASRIFVGVHYPGDVLGGFLLGAVIGTLVAALFNLFARLVLKPAARQDNPQPEAD